MTGMWCASCGQRYSNNEHGCVITMRHTAKVKGSRVVMAALPADGVIRATIHASTLANNFSLVIMGKNGCSRDSLKSDEEAARVQKKQFWVQSKASRRHSMNMHVGGRKKAVGASGITTAAFMKQCQACVSETSGRNASRSNNTN